MIAASLAVLALVLAAPARTVPPTLKNNASLTETDVRRLLHDWSAFDTAMASLQDSVPELPDGGGSPGDLERAEAAWAADARIRRTLESAGTSPETFLALYRKVSEAWWALVETETREHTAAGLRREIEALRATKGAETEAVTVELERGLKVLEEPPANPPDLDVVRRHRADLATIFSPEAPGP